MGMALLVHNEAGKLKNILFLTRSDNSAAQTVL
jgi:hypothetical protein